jgi:hypothetical protein
MEDLKKLDKWRNTGEFEIRHQRTERAQMQFTLNKGKKGIVNVNLS